MKKTLFFIAVLLGLTSTANAQVEWKIWERPASDQKTSVQIPKDLVSTLEDGDKLYATFEKIPESDYWNGNAQVNWKVIDKEITDFDTENLYMSFTITADVLEYINGTSEFTYYYWDDNQWKSTTTSGNAGGDFILSGSNIYFTSVVVKKKYSFIKTDCGISPFITGDWTSGTGVEKDKFANAVVGDYVYVAATRDLQNTPSAEQYWSMGFSATKSGDDKKEIGVSCLDGAWGVITEDKLAYFKDYDGWLGGRYLNVSGMYIYHPITSFSIGSIGLATFCANVAVSVPDGIEAYYATVDDNKIVLTKIGDGVIPANTGVIIKGDAGSVVEFTATTTVNTYSTNVLTGVTVQTTMTAEDYVLYNNNGTAEFRKVTATNLAANKAYLPAAKLNSTAPALSVVFGDDEITSIATPKTTVVTDDQYYDLSGRRIAQPTKGIYIKNGKKIIVK